MSSSLVNSQVRHERQAAAPPRYIVVWYVPAYVPSNVTS